MNTSRCKSILLLGPTGSGKTPLGEAMERTGINGHRAAHFDFGARLRAAVNEPAGYPLLSITDIALLQKKLHDNALLEDDEFFIAERILLSFITAKNLAPDDFLILNGLPRHTGQAQALDRLVSTERVIYLDCSPEVVRQRIQTNAGGDRTMRSDDSVDEVERKLRIFRKRTLLLLDYYRRRKIPIRKLRIEPDTSPEAAMAAAGTNV